MRLKPEDYATIRVCDSWDYDSDNPGKYSGSLIAQYEELIKDKTVWIFRGHKNSKWELKTTLDRLIQASKIEPEKYKEFEGGLLDKFRREYHLYSQRIPEHNDLLEWFSLMQHHGTPTRLLDWTYSFYIATFFALEDIYSPGEDGVEEAAVWAINSDWLEKKINVSNKKAFTCDDRHFRNPTNLRKIMNKSGVVKVNPYYVHERLSVQQGCFLFPGDITESFVENLRALAQSDKDLKENLFQFVINKKKECRDASLQKYILDDLNRMNITRTSLFPGIDGYASSLKVTSFVLPETLKVDAEYKKRFM